MLKIMESHLPISIQKKLLVGIVQLCCTEDVQENFIKVSNYVKECSEAGAKLVCLPENFFYLGQSSAEGIRMSENIPEGQWIKKYMNLAKDNKVWLSLGGFHEKCDSNPDKRFSNFILE